MTRDRLRWVWLIALGIAFLGALGSLAASVETVAKQSRIVDLGRYGNQPDGDPHVWVLEDGRLVVDCDAVLVLCDDEES